MTSIHLERIHVKDNDDSERNVKVDHPHHRSITEEYEKLLIIDNNNDDITNLIQLTSSSPSNTHNTHNLPESYKLKPTACSLKRCGLSFLLGLGIFFLIGYWSCIVLPLEKLGTTYLSPPSDQTSALERAQDGVVNVLSYNVFLRMNLVCDWVTCLGK